MFGPDQQVIPFRRYDQSGWMIASHLIGLALLLAAVIALVFLVRHWSRQGRGPAGLHPGHWGGPHHAHDPAIATVRARYAAGQIGLAEYQALLAGLGVPPMPPMPPMPPAPPATPPPPPA